LPTGGFLRQIVLDTETTGLNPKLGDRIIEIGCVELLSRRLSEREFHAYVNPEREVELGATRVHGLTREDLLAKPKFAEIAPAFLDYIRGAELLIHNADFDVEFLDMELGLAGLGRLQDHVARITDTLVSAKELHPGKKNSLDALCERYFVDNSRRTLHGALADARLLAECYLAMTRGQESLMMELEAPAAAAAAAAALVVDVTRLVVLRASADELAAHEQYLKEMEKDAKGPPLWRRILGSA
jgi:DNA polymerase-3 subunit epsilon